MKKIKKSQAPFVKEICQKINITYETATKTFPKIEEAL